MDVSQPALFIFYELNRTCRSGRGDYGPEAGLALHAGVPLVGQYHDFML